MTYIHVHDSGQYGMSVWNECIYMSVCVCVCMYVQFHSRCACQPLLLQNVFLTEADRAMYSQCTPCLVLGPVLNCLVQVQGLNALPQHTPVSVSQLRVAHSLVGVVGTDSCQVEVVARVCGVDDSRGVGGNKQRILA